MSVRASRTHLATIWGSVLHDRACCPNLWASIRGLIDSYSSTRTTCYKLRQPALANARPAQRLDQPIVFSKFPPTLEYSSLPCLRTYDNGTLGLLISFPPSANHFVVHF